MESVSVIFYEHELISVYDAWNLSRPQIGCRSRKGSMVHHRPTSTDHQKTKSWWIRILHQLLEKVVGQNHARFENTDGAVALGNYSSSWKLTVLYLRRVAKLLTQNLSLITPEWGISNACELTISRTRRLLSETRLSRMRLLRKGNRRSPERRLAADLGHEELKKLKDWFNNI